MKKNAGNRGLTIILVIFALLALVYSMVLPLGEAADETDHFALVRFIAEQGRPPLTVEERRSIGPKGDASPIYHGLVALLTQHIDVSDLPDLPHTQRQPERFISSDGFRANLIFHTEDESFPFHDIVLAWHLARLVSIPLGAATIIAVYLTALAIYQQNPYSTDEIPWLALAATSFAAFLPRFVISSAVVNDDNLVIPLVSFSVYYLVRVAQGDERRRTFAILGVLAGLAAITKYHSLVLLVEVTLVLIVLAWTRGRMWRLWLRRWGWTMFAFVLSSGWWFVFLVIRFNQVAELGWVRGLMAPLGDPVVTSGFGRMFDFQPGGSPVYQFGWLDWAELLFRSFWIVYGWIHVFATPAVYRVLALFSLISLVGLIKLVSTRLFSNPRPAPSRSARRPELAVLAFHFFVYLAVVGTRYLLRPDPETGQGRHLYPALASIAVLFVLGLREACQVFSWRPGGLLDRAKTYWPNLTPTRGIYRLDRVLAIGVGGTLAALSLLTPPVFILPVYRPYLPIATMDPSDADIGHRLEVSFAPGLNLVGYDLEESQAQADGTLPLSLYWHAGARQTRDYLVKVCLHDSSGQTVTCRAGHPVDGRYPTRAWEAGYLIRDEMYLPIPDCAPEGNYEVILSLLPLRPDTASTSVEQEAAINAVSLGWVKLALGPAASSDKVSLWVGNRRYVREGVELKQIRQALLATTYVPSESISIPEGRLVPADYATGSDVWKALPPQLTYRCLDGRTAVTYNFILDQSVRPGQYYLEVGNQVERALSVTALTHPRDFSPPSDIPAIVNALFLDEVKLLGYEADMSARWPGDSIPIVVYWQSQRMMNRNYIVGLHLLDNTMNSWGQVDQILGSHYPNVLWAPGETVSEVYRLPINSATPAGLYTVEFSLYDYVLGTFHYLPATIATISEPAKHLYWGPIRVMDPAQTRPPSHLLVVELGNQIQLLGYDISSEILTLDEPLNLALHWQAIAQPTIDYTVFTQLVGPDGLVWGQKDNQPQGGRYPTTAWSVHDKVIDRYEFKLKPGAPPGQYRLLVGMYDLATGQRLAAIDQNGNQLPDNAILLTTLELE